MNPEEPNPIRALRDYSSPTSAAPWPYFACSALLHGLVLLLPLLVSIQWVRTRQEPPPQPTTTVRVFIPKPAPPEDRRVISPTAATNPVPAAATSPAPIEKVPVDMGSIELSFATDTSNQLPEVIRQQRGVLALVDKSDPTIARYVFEPPQWVFHPGIVDISDKVRFAMYPPERWSAVNELAAEHGLHLDQFEVCALFETNYTSCLRDAISLRATSDRRSAGTRVTAARLAFSAASPCGVDVLEVSFAANR